MGHQLGLSWFVLPQLTHPPPPPSLEGEPALFPAGTAVGSEWLYLRCPLYIISVENCFFFVLKNVLLLTEKLIFMTWFY